MHLRPVAADADPVLLAAELAPAFGDDPDAARETLEQTFRLLIANTGAPPWGCYLAEAGSAVVGTCAFKTSPDADGRVEIAYMTFPACEGRGHATAMAGKLYDLAASAGVSLVIAHTLPEENASNGALRRNGFAFVGTVEDPEDGPVWRWEKPVRA